MKNLLITISIAILTATAVNANDAEATLEKELGQRIQYLQNALTKYKEMKRAIQSDDQDREVVLRKVCKRMKRDIVKVDGVIDSLDVYLAMKETRKVENESERTNDSIKNLKDQIQQLKQNMDTNKPVNTVIAAN